MQERVFVISPSYQADWHLSARFLMLTGAVLFLMCLYFLNLGLWLIVPFAGLEFAALAWALWVSAEKSHEKNVLKISQDKVTLEKGKRERTSTTSFDRIWCEVVLEYLPRPWKHSQLFLRTRDVKVEFAEFLDTDEHKALARELKPAIGAVGV